MTAIRELIFASMAAALAANASAGEVERMASGDPLGFPARHIGNDGQAVLEGEVGATRYALSCSIEGYVEGQGGAAAAAQLNQLYADTVRTVMALIGTVPQIENVEEGDMRVAVASLASTRRLAFSTDFTITYATRRGDPETL